MIKNKLLFYLAAFSFFLTANFDLTALAKKSSCNSKTHAEHFLLNLQTHIGQFSSANPASIRDFTPANHHRRPDTPLTPKGGTSIKSLPDPYTGVKDASNYLKNLGVPRSERVTILQSFDIPTIKLNTAGSNNFGLRFHDFGKNAHQSGQYLFDTFTPLTNRTNLSLPYNWNNMTGIKQWQISPGSQFIGGKAAPQLNYGSQFIGGENQIFLYRPWETGSLLNP